MRMRHIIPSFFAMMLIASLLVPGHGIGAPIPSEVKSVVAFIFVKNAAGQFVPNGTGFFVGIRNPSNPQVGQVYLVTAKHILFKPKSTIFLDQVFVRLNKKDGESQFTAVPLTTDGDKRNVFVHSDTSVDLAAIPFFLDQKQFDAKFLPEEMMTTKEEFRQLNIREGSDVFFTGLFSHHIGSQRNYPVVRFGKIALVTEEKIEWQGRLMDLYLVEAGSYGGNSGSPVFFYLGIDREPGQGIHLGAPILKLAGIMQGTFLDAQEVKVIDTKLVPFALSNMGIAAVVPAYKLVEIFTSDIVKQTRRF